MKVFLILSTLLFAGPLFSYPMTPDPQETPGELCDLKDRDYTERRYPEKIIYCTRNVSSSFKRKIYDNYNIHLKERGSYTIDHLIPLSIGGDNSEDNLWPEHKAVKALRPNLEFDIFEELKAGEIAQEEAVEIILYAKMNPDEPPPRFLKLRDHFENFKSLLPTGLTNY